ncbi:hypothetical protein M2345_003201 [Sphingobium sp. B8D3D]|nr:hypothetical protein [Sphingobium sp. B8D3D]MCW2414259.1 hypothetical protein [Sphingobium sp. B8D3A]
MAVLLSLAQMHMAISDPMDAKFPYQPDGQAVVVRTDDLLLYRQMPAPLWDVTVG